MSVSRRCPVISVVLTTFDRPTLLLRALEGVVLQTYRNFELIVVDDGSREPVAPLLDTLPDLDARLVTHPRQRGASAARNAGIREARGDFIALLDDDDSWLPDKLGSLLDRLEKEPASTGLVFSGYELVSDRTGRVVLTHAADGAALSRADLLRSSIFGTSVPLIRKECFERVGLFDESLPGMQDRDLWLRIGRHFAFAAVPDVLTRIHIHGRQITTDLPAKRAAKEQMLLKYRDEFEGHPDILGAQLTRLAMLHFACGAAAEGRRRLREAFQVGEKHLSRRRRGESASAALAQAQLSRGLGAVGDRCVSREDLVVHATMSRVATRLHRSVVSRRMFHSIDGITLYY